MRTFTLYWPTRAKQDLKFEVQVNGEDWKIYEAQAWVPALHDWIDITEKIVAMNIWGDFVNEGVTRALLSELENEAVDKGKDQKLFEARG